MNNLVVISRFNEDANWVKNLNWDYLIYNKGETISGIYKQIPNIGREGETYLRYIIEFYYNLPDYTAFVQGNPFPHCTNLINILNNFSSSDQVVNLSNKFDWWCYPFNQAYSCKAFPNPSDDPYIDVLAHNVKFLKLNHSPNTWSYPIGAQYIVPKKYITTKSIAWWEECYNLYISNFKNPWVFERLWPLIFHHHGKI
jgi:hypothetical protein